MLLLLPTVLMGMGLDEYSMSASSILRTRSMMKDLDTKECAKLVEKAMELDTNEEVADLVKKELNLD